ncbi:MAG: 50S ribosomal protein L18 [Candidatus Pacebacteria bacterium]|nr:50S ribosomal protein L18 [Candidatus Paceibacterota bacterium]
MDTNRTKRHNRIRAKITGTAERPRLCIYKSNRYLEAQVIDDTKGATLAAVKMDDAKKAGQEIAKAAMAKGVSAVVFDRGGFRYTGAIAVLADAAREAGLKF